VSLAQSVETMHNICKVQGLNLDHHKKQKKNNLDWIWLRKIL